MLETEISLTKTSSQQLSDRPVWEIQSNEYLVDCYPYATRGVLFAILFGSLFWGITIGVLMLLL